MEVVIVERRGVAALADHRLEPVLSADPRQNARLASVVLREFYHEATFLAGFDFAVTRCEFDLHFADRGSDWAQCRFANRNLELGTASSLEPMTRFSSVEVAPVLRRRDGIPRYTAVSLGVRCSARKHE